jgi:hypothetical protein
LTIGLSPVLAGIALFAGMFIGCFVLIVALALSISPKYKIQ